MNHTVVLIIITRNVSEEEEKRKWLGEWREGKRFGGVGGTSWRMVGRFYNLHRVLTPKYEMMIRVICHSRSAQHAIIWTFVLSKWCARTESCLQKMWKPGPQTIKQLGLGLGLRWWWYGETGCWRCMKCRLFSGNVGGGECGEDKRLKTVDYWSAEVRGMIPLSFISFTLPPHHHACAIPHVGTSSWPFPVITFSLTSHKSTVIWCSKQSF